MFPAELFVHKHRVCKSLWFTASRQLFRLPSIVLNYRSTQIPGRKSSYLDLTCIDTYFCLRILATDRISCRRSNGVEDPDQIDSMLSSLVASVCAEIVRALLTLADLELILYSPACMQ